MTALRRAGIGDAPRLQYVADLAYSPYLPRMGGIRPGPMDTDYDVAVLETEAWVAEVDGETHRAIELGFARAFFEKEL